MLPFPYVSIMFQYVPSCSLSSSLIVPLISIGFPTIFAGDGSKVMRLRLLFFSENEPMWWILVLPLYATSSGVCHFLRMPLQVACHFERRMPLRVACHFKWRMPLQVAYATSSGVPLQVAYATSSGVPLRVAWDFEWRMPPQVACHFEWRMPLRVAHAASSGVPLRVAYAIGVSCHFKSRADCVAFAFRVAYATSSGVSHREHATSRHFNWRMPLRVARRTVSVPLHATSSGACHFEWRVTP